MSIHRILAVVVIALSIFLHSLFHVKPRISGPKSADAHYGEGQIYAFDPSQRKQIDVLMKQQGNVTKEQIEKIMEDGSGSARLWLRK